MFSLKPPDQKQELSSLFFKKLFMLLVKVLCVLPLFHELVDTQNTLENVNLRIYILTLKTINIISAVLIQTFEKCWDPF